MKTKVLICGIVGKMGSTSANAISQTDDLEVCAGVVGPGDSLDPVELDGKQVPVFAELSKAIDAAKPDIMLDFTNPQVVAGDIECALGRGVNCVIGTTGLSQEVLEKLAAGAKNGAALFVAPNFTTGAVLMMQFAKMAARFFPDAEVIELHHVGKKDAPSGTAIRTAQMIAAAKSEPTTAPGKETELDGMAGARGALVDGVPVHSVRTSGYVAHQEVIFGSPGQTLTIRHDSIDRQSYMPGVLLALRKVSDMTGLVVGLENLMDL